MKTALSHRFHIIPPDLLLSDVLLGITPYIPTGSYEVSARGAVSFTQDPVSDENGISWDLKFAATSDDLSLIKLNGSRAIIAFHMTDGSLRYIGNSEECPLITITPHAGVVRISAEITAFEPILL